MAKTAKKLTKKSLGKDYERLFKNQPVVPFVPAAPQWLSQGDYFVKFTLYKETPSIASPNTSFIFNS